MRPQLERLKAGQRLDGIPARAWNAFVDAAEYVQALQSGLGGSTRRPARQSTIVKVKNNSGTDRDRFDVLGIDDWFPSPSQNANQFKTGPVLHGVTPDADVHRGKFAILLEPAPAGKIVSGCVAGVCTAKVDVPSETELMTHADVKDGNAGSLLAEYYGSAKILKIQSGTGIRWAQVHLGPVNSLRRFEMTAALSLPQTGQGEASVTDLDWDASSGRADALTGRTFTAVDTMRMHSKMATASGDVGAYGLAHLPYDRADGKWEILTMQTPGPFFGSLDSALSQASASVSVTAFDIRAPDVGHKTLSGYDVFGSNFGDSITVYNPPADTGSTPSSYWFRAAAGDIVFCMWHMRAAKYYIIFVEPQEQTVVTSINWGAQTHETKDVGVLWSI